MARLRIRAYPPTPRDRLAKAKAFVGLSLNNWVSDSATSLRHLFKHTVNLVGSFDVLVGDYFHRHNLQDLRGLSAREASARASAEGEAIASRAREVLLDLGLGTVKVRTAGELVRAPEFRVGLRTFGALCSSDELLSELIEQGTDAFLGRVAPKRLHLAQARGHCRQYQVEELALFSVLARDGYRVCVYPGAHMLAFRELVAGAHRGSLPEFDSFTLIELRYGSRA